ncbi:MAG: SDR family NAD(P)-dependent oxidoreductase, partial [Nitrospinales bacterium]|nr:SDR family NAD(P)-dependent oxidoreductase [Nitrospinales bacterium]
MEGKSILITGCSSGIGLCVAEGLFKRGYRVFATARKQKDVKILLDKGMESFQLDLDDSVSIKRAVDAVLNKTGGKLFALFNNGGFGQPGAVEDLRRDVLREQFETNVFGYLELTNLILPTMRRQGYGRIIQSSSILGFISLPFRGAYIASKHALEGLSDTLRMELRGTNIYISIIEPGPIEAKFRQNAYAKYKENIDAKSSYFHGKYKVMEERLTKETTPLPFALPATAVLEKVLQALENS